MDLWVTDGGFHATRFAALQAARSGSRPINRVLHVSVAPNGRVAILGALDVVLPDPNVEAPRRRVPRKQDAAGTTIRQQNVPFACKEPETCYN